MTMPLGEGLSAHDPDALLNIPAPTTELLEPTTAPADMLACVQVNTQGRCLQADTPLGTIAVEMYWKTADASDDEAVRGDFFPALSTAVDPEAGTNPPATQTNPYTILPDGALYEIVVRTPLDAVDTAWSQEHTIHLGEYKATLLGGISLAEFRRAYPWVEVDLPEGQYAITATERTKPTLAIAARVEDGEPLARTQTINGSTVHYKETFAGGFMRSGLQPDTAVSILNSRITIRDGGTEADRQRLEFKTHDGFQRTGEGAKENSGAAEVIVLQGDAVEYTGFTFTPWQSPILPRSSYEDYGLGGGFATRGGSYSTDDTSKGLGGLSGGETRYRPPETVKVSMTGIRNLRAIAAFRFAMAGAHEIPASDQI